MAKFYKPNSSNKSDDEILELDYSTATNDGNDSIKIETGLCPIFFITKVIELI